MSRETTGRPLEPHTLRIAFFSDSMSERNGTGAYYHDLVEHLRPRVAGISVLQPRPRTRPSPLSMPLPGDATQKIVIPNVFRVRRELARFRPHVIVSVTPGPFGLLGLWMARRHRCGYVSAYHTHFEDLVHLYWKPWRRGLPRRVLRGVNRLLCRRSETVLVNNSDLADIVRELGAPRVEVMGTPLESGFIDTPPPPPPTGLGRVCFAGRLATEKNLEAVIEAARAWPDIEFVVGGDGPQRPDIESAVRELDNLDYRGWLDRPALIDMIDQASLLVLPSHAETFGSIAMEAMARRRPALVSANAGIHDWSELTGGLFRLEPGETLSAALGRLREQPRDDWIRAGEEAREAALALNDRTLRQWLSVLSRHARRSP